MTSDAGTLANEAFQFLRVIAFVTPSVALLMNLINPRRERGVEEYDVKIFPWVLGSFILMILAGVVDVFFLIVKIPALLTTVKFILFVGLLTLLWATCRFLYAIRQGPRRPS